MKIVAICGSPRGKRSQTRMLTERLLGAAESDGAATELLDLSRSRVEFCRACETCHQRAGCAVRDDVPAILQKMLEADAVVFASPVYLSQVTAQLKAVLDRTSHFVHCLRLRNKYAACVVTCGGGGCQETKAFLRSYAFSVGAQFVGGVEASMPVTDLHVAQAEKLGHALANAVRQKKQYPVQLRIIEERRRYFGHLVRLRRDAWPYEFEYWRKQGWMEA